jgi:formate-dependent nitrite reductase membrane component NrfD
LVPQTSVMWIWVAPVVAGAFLAVTGGLLLWDLEHPKRFYLIFTRPQWKSWLVKGAFIIAGYSLILFVHFVVSILGHRGESSDLLISSGVPPGAIRFLSWLMIGGVPLAILSAVYTAYLFAQAKARDMWQNPLLPSHLLVQSLLLGSSVLLPLAAWLEPGIVLPLLWTLAITSLIHLLMIWGEVSLTHPTAHARLAIWEMVHGRYRGDFWIGTALSIVGGLLPAIAILGALPVSVGISAAPMALMGMMLFEHAYVQAGQSVPLA